MRDSQIVFKAERCSSEQYKATLYTPLILFFACMPDTAVEEPLGC